MFKKSYYNEIINLHNDGSMLLFNSRTGALTLMNLEAQKIYNNIENINETSINNLKEKEYLNTMKQSGFIIDSDINELKLMESIERMARYNSNSLTLTIAPTTKCNMACPYCYEGNTIKKQPSMDEDVKKYLINFVKEKTKNVTMFDVCWYGGEPLLEKDTILELSREFIKICNESKIKYTARIISNGILLDYETALMLKNQCKVNNVQITLDGPKNINDNRRLLKDSRSSFDIITKNIDDIKDILQVTIRINADKDNLYLIDELVDYIIDIKKWGGKVKFYIHEVFDGCNVCSGDENYVNKETEFSKYLKTFIERVHNKGSVDYIAKPYLKPKSLSCGATKYNSFLIDPYGDIYKCLFQIGDINKKIGNVKYGNTLNAEYIKWLTIDIPHECELCKNLPQCKGGCPLSRINNGNKPVCDPNVLTYKQVLNLKYNEYKDSKVKNI